MKIVELQKESRIFRVTEELSGKELIIIMDDGDLQFYGQIELKYGYYESCLEKEKKGTEEP